MFWSKKNKEPEKVETNLTPLYTLELKIEGVEPQEIPIEDDLLIGSSEKAHICIDGAGLIPEHATLKLEGKYLSVLNHAEKDSSINDQILQKNKSYILNNGDQLVCGAATFIVKTINESQTPIENKELGLEDNKIQTTVSEENLNRTTPTMTRLISDEDELKKPETPKEEESPAVEVAKKAKTKEFQLSPKKKTPSPQKKPSSAKSSFWPLENAPGASLRLYAFITNLCIIYGILYSALPLIDPSKIVDQNLNLLISFCLPYLEKFIIIPKQFQFAFITTLKFYFLYCAVDILCSGLLGVNLAYRLLGFKTDDPGFISSFKGVCRALIGALTTPLIIFDLPLLFGRKSLKELLTFTQLTGANNFLRYAGIFILLPLISLFSLISPTLDHLDQFSAITFSDQKEEQVVGAIKKASATASETTSATITRPIEINWQIHSEVLGIRTEIHFSDNLIILPLGSRGILFLDKNNSETFSELTLKSEINFNDVIPLASQGNPFFFLLFGHLHSLIEQDKDLSLESENQKDLHRLLVGSLKLNSQMITFDDPLEDASRIGQYFLEYGPFIAGYLKTRDATIAKLGIPSGATVSLLNQKKNDFIRVSPNPTTILYALIASPEKTSPVLEYKTDKASAKLGMKVIRQLLDGNWTAKTASSTNLKLLESSTTTETTPHLTQLEKENAFAMVDYLENFKSFPKSPLLDNATVSNYFQNEYEKIRSFPPESQLVKKFKETLFAYANELKKLSQSDDTNTEKLVNEIEIIARGEIPAPPVLTPTPAPTPTPSPTPTPTPVPVVKPKKKGKK